MTLNYYRRLEYNHWLEVGGRLRHYGWIRRHCRGSRLARFKPFLRPYATARAGGS